jgi:type IV pilus assembly protein PilP
MRTTTLRTLAVAAVATSLSGCFGSNMSDLREEVATIKRTTPGAQMEPLPKLEPYRPFAYAAYGLRNPFEAASFLDEIVEQDKSTGPRPDPLRPRELLEQFNLESLEMVGTINKEGLWVLVEGPNSVVHRVTMGNYLGTNHGRITDISDERVDLIEIVPDGLGGWEQRESFLSLND